MQGGEERGGRGAEILKNERAERAREADERSQGRAKEIRRAAGMRETGTVSYTQQYE